MGKRLLNLKTLLSFALAVVLLGILLRTARVDLARTVEHITRADPLLFALAFATYACTFPARGLRWRRLMANLGHPGMSVPHLMEVIFLSWFVNSILPGKLGDLYRGYLIRRNDRLPFSKTMGTIVAERIIDTSALVAALGLSGLIVMHGRLTREFSSMLQVGLVLLLAMVAGLVVMWRFGPWLVRFFSTRIQTMYTLFAQGTFRSFQAMPTVLAFTALAWLAEAGRLYLVTRAVHLTLDPASAVFVVAAASLLLIVPTPGGLGAVEGGIVAMLVLLGADKEIALSAAILDRAISYWSLIVFGVPLYLFSRKT